MIKHGEVNPLDVFDLRQVNFCPPHFEKIAFDIRTSEKVIRDWIFENCEGRFFLGDMVAPNETGAPVMHKVAAFERHSEATYFGLFLPTINGYRTNDLLV